MTKNKLEYNYLGLPVEVGLSVASMTLCEQMHLTANGCTPDRYDKDCKECPYAANNTTMWWLMDGRASYSIDDATVLETCNSEKEAYRNINDYGADTCIVEVPEEGDPKLLWSLSWGKPQER